MEEIYTSEEIRDAYDRFGALLDWRGSDHTITGEMLRAMDALMQGFHTNDSTVADSLGSIDRFFQWVGGKFFDGFGLPDENAGLRMMHFCDFLRFFHDNHDAYLDCLDVAVKELVDFLPDHPELADAPCEVSCMDFWEPQDEPDYVGFDELERIYFNLYWGGERVCAS